MKVGLLSVSDDLKRIEATRKAIGTKHEKCQNLCSIITGLDIKLMVDANHAYNVPTAVTLAKKMEQFDISWFEEPVIPEDVDGYRRVKSQTSIPIAGGECSFMRYGFRDMFAG